MRHGIPWSADLFLVFWPRVFKALIWDAHQFSLSSFQSGPMFWVKIVSDFQFLKPLRSLIHLKSMGRSFCISATSDFFSASIIIMVRFDWYLLINTYACIALFCWIIAYVIIIFCNCFLGIEQTTIFWPCRLIGSKDPVVFKLKFCDAGEGCMSRFNHILPVSARLENQWLGLY